MLNLATGYTGKRKNEHVDVKKSTSTMFSEFLSV
jgi:hypothetical protein